MDKQTTIAFILIGAILVLWLYISAPDPKQQTKSKDKTTEVKDSTTTTAADTNSIVTSPTKETQKEISDFPNQNVPEEYIYIETQFARFELSNKGANFRKIFLSKYNNWYSAHKTGDENDFNNHVQLINYKRGGSYDISFVSNDGKGINTKELTFISDKSPLTYKLSQSDSLTINYTFELETGKTLLKSYTFFADKYEIRSKITFTGFSNLISNNSYDLIWSN